MEAPWQTWIEMSTAIQLLLTGGTFDKNYNPLTGELVFYKTHLPKLLDQVNFQGDVHLQTLFLKDSAEFSEDDRKLIIDTISSSSYQRIIVIHGTDTMCQSAEALDVCDKTIIFTGAMKPWKLGNSDAEFNLGMAIALTQCLKTGIYITMQGEFWSAGDVLKHPNKGLFIAR